MKIKRKKIFGTFGLLIFILMFFVLYFSGYITDSVNYAVVLSFLLNFIIIIFEIAIDMKPYSLNKVFWYFCLFFMFVAPFFQYLTGYNVWNYQLTEAVYIKTNFCLTICFLCYSVFDIYLKLKKTKSIPKTDISININGSYVLLILSFISLGIVLIKTPLKSLFFRSAAELGNSSNGINVIFSHLLKSIPVYSCVYSYINLKKNKTGKVPFVLSLILSIIMFFPQSNSRYLLAIVYIGFAILFFGKCMTSRLFDYMMISIFMIAFPIFQVFKWVTIDDIVDNPSIILKKISKTYNNVDFDAYSMFSRTIIYVENNGTTGGNQILSTIFFYIPRSIWETKPYITGRLISSSQGQSFTNLSEPIFAEGYVDFNYFGMILYSLIMCLLIYKLDSKYWNFKNKNDLLNFYYPFCFGAIIFILRGSLQPSFIYSFSFFLFSLIIIVGCKIKRKIGGHYGKN